MNTPSKQYWFPAKRHGWGWGAPATWQGWAVLVSFLVAIGVIVWRVPQRTEPGLFWGLVLAASAVFAVIVWLKGEPPGWHWGG